VLLAKIALGFGGTLALFTAYAFHEGVVRIDEDHPGGQHVHVWVPAAIVPLALHVVPRRHFEWAAVEVSPWLPTIRAAIKGLKRFPEARLVEVRDSNQHVVVGMHDGKLTVDVDAPDENVHVSCPLAMVESVTRALEDDAPAV
jgi:hypothetical protein